MEPGECKKYHPESGGGREKSERFPPFDTYPYDKQAAETNGVDDIPPELFFHAVGNEHLAPVGGKAA